MSFKEKWRFIIKCMKYSYNLKINLICISFIFVLGLLYEIMDIGGGMGTYLLLILSMYPAQMLYSICGSHLIQSSPYKKALMTKLPTVVTLCCGILIYLLVVVIKTIRVVMKLETTEQSVYAIVMAGVILLLLNIYVGIIYKYFWVSMIIMCVSVVGIYSNIGLIGRSHLISLLLTQCSLPVAIAAGVCLALLGSLLQYGISLLVYKKPVSKRAIYGMMRQQI